MLHTTLTLANAEKIIYIVPAIDTPTNGGLFAPKEFNDSRRRFIALKEVAQRKGYTLQATKDISDKKNVVAVVVFTTMHINQKLLQNLQQYPKRKRILFLSESPLLQGWAHDSSITKHWGKVFTVLDNFVDNKKFFKYYYPQSSLQMIGDIPPFEQKKFCTLIAGNKDFCSKNKDGLYVQRRKTIKFFEDLHTNEFDLYGIGWNKKKNPSYQGAIKNKTETLKHYKFCICYENIKNTYGYISEKIFDCLIAGCIPIYWGAANVTSYIPKNCFIDRRAFNSLSDLYRFLKKMNEDTYNQYLVNIRKFLNSEKVNKFSINHFTKTFLNAVEKP